MLESAGSPPAGCSSLLPAQGRERPQPPGPLQLTSPAARVSGRYPSQPHPGQKPRPQSWDPRSRREQTDKLQRARVPECWEQRGLQVLAVTPGLLWG